MQRKISAIGNSYGVSIPKEILKKLHLKAGAHVEVNIDENEGKIIIEPVSPTKYKAIDVEFVSQVNDFIKQYRPALKALAEK